MKKITTFLLAILFSLTSFKAFSQVNNNKQHELFGESILTQITLFEEEIESFKSTMNLAVSQNWLETTPEYWLMRAKDQIKAGTYYYSVRETILKVLALDGSNIEGWQLLAKIFERNNLAFSIAAQAKAYILSENRLSQEERIQVLTNIADTLLKINSQESLKNALLIYTKLNEWQFNAKRAETIRQLAELVTFAPKKTTTVDTGDERQVCVHFNEKLSQDRSTRWADYIRVEPASQLFISLQSDGKALCVDGLAYGQDYQFVLLKGLPSSGEERLAQNQSINIVAANRAASMGFKNKAYILPKIGSTGVPLLTVNYDEAYLRLFRINDRNILNDFVKYNFLGNIERYNLSDISEQYGETVWQGTVQIQNQKNQRITTAIPMLDMVNNQLKPGVYILAAGKAVKNDDGSSIQLVPANQDEDDYYGSVATQWLVVTDLGISTYSGENGLTVAVRSLENGKALNGVKVRLFARNNEQLGEAVTNKDGMASFNPELLMGTGGRTPVMVMTFSAKGDDFAFLSIDKAAYDLSDRGAYGRSYSKNYDLFLYTDRGVYRPGETVRLAGLLRNNQGVAVTKLPLTIEVRRPDGVLANKFVLNDVAVGGYEVSIPTTATSLTGRWYVYGYVDPKGDAVGRADYLVEEVVPAQLEVTLKSSHPEITASAIDAFNINIKADYLYGAPAADLAVKAQIVFKQNDTPYPDFKDYQFGLITEPFTSVIQQLDADNTNENGQLDLNLSTVTIPETLQPIVAQVSVGVIEPSGRPVLRSVALPVRGENPFIGIKSVQGTDVNEGSTVDFMVVMVGPDGKQQSFKDLKWQLHKENYRYQWYYRSGYWDYTVSVQDELVAGGVLSGNGSEPVKISSKVNWGRYRLEVFNADGTAASSMRIYAGWGWGVESADTPDKLEIVADKTSYLPGEKAKLSIRAPFKGELLINVATDRIVSSQNIAVSPEGTVIEIPVSKEWGAGAYILATAFRPGSASDRGPGRAIGLTWIGINKDINKLNVSISVPDKVEPNQQIIVPVKVTGLKSGQSAYITVAAVDEGVLSLTDFRTPDPLQYFFGRRTLGLDLRDLYGQLIDGKSGRRGEIREGGDAAAEKGAPPVIKLVALYSGMIKVDDQGNANVKFDLPDYNGKLRIMAVVHSQDKVGSAEANLIVRAPMVATLNMPRFLALDDKSQFVLMLQNMDALPGTYKVSLENVSGELLFNETQAMFQLELKQGEQAKQILDVQAQKLGTGMISLKIDGPNGFSLSRQFFVKVRSAQPLLTERVVKMLKTGENFTLDPTYFNRFIPETVQFKSSVSNRPNFDVAGLIDELDRYPYGCLEQVTSRVMPLVYLFELAEKWDVSVIDNPEDINVKIQRAISMLVEKQRLDGSFGLWSANSETEKWLTAYVIDFMTRAKAKGHAVSDLSYRQGLAWLAKYAQNYDLVRPSDLSSRAYAMYVLSKAGAGDIAMVRYFFDNYAKNLPDTLSLAQISAALSVYGDQERARTGFEMALGKYKTKLVSWADYGSDIRDLAAIITLISESQVKNIDYATELNLLTSWLQNRRYLSTQEQLWLVLAARSLAGQNVNLNLTVNGFQNLTGVKPILPKQNARDLTQKGFGVVNNGSLLWVATSITGVSSTKLPAISNGFTITKRYFDINGEEIDIKNLQQTDMVVVVIEGVAKHDLSQQSLIVDLLPAGLELENSRLSNTLSLDSFDWIGELSPTEHQEYLDDRFVAAVWTQSGKNFKVAYLARVVTPGTYQVPAVQIEAMYAPEIRARSTMMEMTIVPFKAE